MEAPRVFEVLERTDPDAVTKARARQLKVHFESLEICAAQRAMNNDGVIHTQITDVKLEIPLAREGKSRKQRRKEIEQTKEKKQRNTMVLEFNSMLE